MDENQGKTGAGTKKLFKAAICPNCGGELQLDADQEQAFCIYCGSKIIVKEAVRKVVVDNRLTVENMMKAAQIAYRAGDYDEAEDRYSRVLEMDPDNYDAVFWEGICLGMKNSEKTRELVKYAQVSLEVFSKRDIPIEEIYQRRNYMGTELMKVAKEHSSIRYYVIRLLDNPLTWEDAGKRASLRAFVKDSLTAANGYITFYQQNGEEIEKDKVKAELKSILSKLTQTDKREEKAEKEQKRQKAESEQARYWAEHYEELLENIEALKKNILSESGKIKDFQKQAEEMINQINSCKEELQKRRYYLAGKKSADYSGIYSDFQALTRRLEQICDDAVVSVKRCCDLKGQIVAQASYLRTEDKDDTDRFLEERLFDKKEWEKLKEQTAGGYSYISDIVEKKRQTVLIAIGAGVAAVAAVIFIGLNFYYRVIVPKEEYSKAVVLLKEGKFGEAKTIFDELGYNKGKRFSDGEIVVDSNLETYLRGRVLWEKGEYKEAAKAFRAVGDYEDAYEMEAESSYQFAKQVFDNGDFQGAAVEFGRLDGYRDSIEMQIQALFKRLESLTGTDTYTADRRREVCEKLEGFARESERYRKAILAEGNTILDTGDYENAARVYQMVQNDEEAEELYKEAVYLLGNKMMDTGVYKRAIENYLKIRGYKDVEYRLGLAYYYVEEYGAASKVWSGIQNTDDFPGLMDKMRDAEAKAVDLNRKTIYSYAEKLMKSANFQKAREELEKLPDDYERTSEFKELIDTELARPWVGIWYDDYDIRYLAIQPRYEDSEVVYECKFETYVRAMTRANGKTGVMGSDGRLYISNRKEIPGARYKNEYFIIGEDILTYVLEETDRKDVPIERTVQYFVRSQG